MNQSENETVFKGEYGPKSDDNIIQKSTSDILVQWMPYGLFMLLEALIFAFFALPFGTVSILGIKVGNFYQMLNHIDLSSGLAICSVFFILFLVMGFLFMLFNITLALSSIRRKDGSGDIPVLFLIFEFSFMIFGIIFAILLFLDGVVVGVGPILIILFSAHALMGELALYIVRIIKNHRKSSTE